MYAPWFLPWIGSMSNGGLFPVQCVVATSCECAMFLCAHRNSGHAVSKICGSYLVTGGLVAACARLHASHARHDGGYEPQLFLVANAPHFSAHTGPLCCSRLYPLNADGGREMWMLLGLLRAPGQWSCDVSCVACTRGLCTALGGLSAASVFA